MLCRPRTDRSLGSQRPVIDTRFMGCNLQQPIDSRQYKYGMVQGLNIREKAGRLSYTRFEPGCGSPLLNHWNISMLIERYVGRRYRHVAPKQIINGPRLTDVYRTSQSAGWIIDVCTDAYCLGMLACMCSSFAWSATCVPTLKRSHVELNCLVCVCVCVYLCMRCSS
jgi:hypothetical protein